MAVLDALWLPVMLLYGVVLFVFFCIGANLSYLTFLAFTRPPRHRAPRLSLEPEGRLNHGVASGLSALPTLSQYPAVTVQLPIFNELYVVERLIRAACDLDWPWDRLEIQVLDDSTDETQFVAARLVQKYAAQGIHIVHVRRADRTGYKAGALQAGLDAARGEFVAIFDADFVPPRDFLQATVPYFSNSRVAFVQARWGHLNREYSLLTQLQAVIIDAHFLVDQVARNRGGYFMNFNGTAGVWRRAAIVDAGGWEHDTLAEDLDLSYRAQLRGWEAVYLPELVAYAELPATVAAYRRQQRRWAAGSFACAIKLLPRIFRAPLSLAVKVQATLHLLGYVSHLCLLTMLLLQPLLLYYAHSALSIGGLWPLAILFVLPGLAPGLYLLYGQWVGRADSQEGTRWFSFPSGSRPSLGGTVIRRLPYVPLAAVMGAGIMLTVVGALARALFAKEVAFERTPKYGIAHGSDSWDGKAYALGSDPSLALEMLLAGFSLATATYAASLHNWGSLFYMGYFLTGLLFFLLAASFDKLRMSWPVSARSLASPELRITNYELRVASSELRESTPAPARRTPNPELDTRREAPEVAGSPG